MYFNVDSNLKFKKVAILRKEAYLNGLDVDSPISPLVKFAQTAVIVIILLFTRKPFYILYSLAICVSLHILI